MWILILTFTAIWMAICYKIAGKNGRSKNLALLLGLLFGLFSVIGYLIIGETEEKKLERIKKVMNK